MKRKTAAQEGEKNMNKKNTYYLLVCDWGNDSPDYLLFEKEEDARHTMRNLLEEFEQDEDGLHDIDRRSLDECVDDWGYCSEYRGGDDLHIEEVSLQ